MPRYPNAFDYGQSREYYGPSLSNPRFQPDMWTNRPPSGFYDEQHPTSSMLMAGGVAAGVFAGGYLTVGKKRMWDRYVSLIRGVEEYSPGGIFRTFQASTFFSQFTSQAQTQHFIKPDLAYANYLATLVGESGKTDIHRRILHEGITFSGGKVYPGQFIGVKPILEHASLLISPAAPQKIAEDVSQWVGGELGTVAGKHYGSAYARSIGLNLESKRYGYSGKDARLYGEVFEEAGERFHRQIVGGKTFRQHYGRLASAWGTEWVSRFNRLLEAPFEMQPFSTIFKRFGEKVNLAVPYSSGMKMMGSLAMKYGPIAGGVALGYQTLDHLLRTSETLEDSVLGTGITGTIATGWTQANLLMSKAAEITGGHAYREWQEELAPGSTQFSRLLAVPLMGALGAAGIGYGLQVAEMARLQVEEDIGAATARTLASEKIGQWGEKGVLGKLGKQLTTTKGLYSRQDWIGKAMKIMANPVYGGPELSYKFIGKMSPTKLGALIGAGIGTALIAPFLPGALVPGERPDELSAIYSGEQEVGIRKGRWWEFGRTPWEGSRIQYYRPHWYPRMMMRAKERAIWGDKEPSPVEKWWTKEFTYDLEKRDYYDRPYPITSLPFEDMPFIGPILANTIGRLIKPPVLMHTEEWMGEGGEVKAMAPGFGERRTTELGELPPGIPMSPYSAKGMIGEQAYRMTEMIGLPGFTMTSIKESLTGTPDLYDQVMQLESARRAYGFERDYWDLEIGGGLGTTEALRRLYPHRRRQVPLYNPIRNTMPEWMPGPGEKAPDFLHGDPYTKVKEGELRLPGAGYEARFPELEGLSPEEYPAIHQYKILADIAPYSDKFKLALQRVRAQRKFDTWTEYEEKIYNTTQEQLKKRKIKKEFDEYEYLSPMGKIAGENRYYATESSGLLAVLNEMKKNQEEKPGVFTKLFGGYWEMLSHNAETALDSMTPVAPGAKLVHQRTAIEDYHRTQVYGTENAFWSHPMRDFIRPMLTRTAAAMGFEGIPEHLKDKRHIMEYFDILEYVKASRLSNLARMSGDTKAVHEFENKKNETLFGLNPFTYNYSNIFRSLPRSERDYFNAFTAADTTEERAKILDMVPENEKALYVARWKLQFKQDIDKARKMGILTAQQEQEADEMVEGIRSEARSEGMPSSKELFAEYLQTKIPGENYADWYRRTKILSKVPLPGPDWVGWHPSVDLEDVKLKLVQTMGCLLPNSMIHRDYISTIMIQNIKPGDLVMGSEGKQLHVKAVKESNYKGEVLDIKLTGFPFDNIKITPNHLLPYQLRNGKIKYGHAGDLRKWYKMAFPSIIFDETYTSIDLESIPYSKYDWPKNIKITGDLAEVMGWWLAEGSTNTKSKDLKQLTFSLNLQEEKDVATFIQKTLFDTFGGNPTIKEIPKKNSIVVSFFCKPAAKLFVELMGRGSLYKKLDNRILQMSIPNLMRFLQGWQKGDGWISKNEICGLTSSNILAKQLWYIFCSLGYRARFQTIDPRHNKLSKNSSYRIRIGRFQDREAFLKGKYKLNSLFWIGIKHINRSHFEGTVYDLEVESPHWYLTSCGLVHNSDMHEYDLWPSRAQALVNKPYINQQAIRPFFEPEELGEDEMRTRVNDILLANNVKSDVFFRTSFGAKPESSIDIEQDVNIDDALSRLM